jgi:hypothetical protein
MALSHHDCRCSLSLIVGGQLELERPQLGPIPPPYGGQARVAMATALSPLLRPLVGLQHPLALYDTLFPTALSMEASP